MAPATSPPVSLLSVATAVPPHVIGQAEAREQARRLFGPKFTLFEKLAPVFENTGIRTRRSAEPIAWFLEPKDWAQRTRAYLRAADALFVEAAGSALARAGIQATEVDAVVTVSSTGIATPSLEARNMASLGFRPDIQRVPVFGLGCAGGVSGLALAARLARAQPGATVLLVVIELCTLAFRHDELTKANIVATALFGDGAAACVARGGELGPWRVEGSAQHTWPDTHDIMGWNVDPMGFGVIFAQAIPPFLEANLRPAMRALLASMDLAREDIGRFVCHPGGAKVIAALETALELPVGTLDLEREVLADYGNMSAPTALFVLERLLERGAPDRLLLSALGPGFTASAVSLARA